VPDPDKKQPGLFWRTIRVVAPVAVLALLFRAAQDQLANLLDEGVPMHAGLVTAAVVGAVIYRVATASIFSQILGAVRSQLSIGRSTALWLMSESMRWLPGGIWGYASRAVLTTREGIAKERVAVALSLELALTIAAWAIVAVVAGLISGSPADWVAMLPAEATKWVAISLVFGALGISAVAIGRPSWFESGWERLRTLTSGKVNAGPALGALVAYTILNAIRGALLWLLLVALGHGDTPLFAVIGANAIAWLVGFFMIFAPGGLGVREGALAILLMPWLPIEIGAFAAILWRVVQIIEEVIVLLGTITCTRITRFHAERKTDDRLPRQQASSGHTAWAWTGSIVLLLCGGWFTVTVLVPGWLDLSNRTATSPFGVSTVRRQAGGFPVETARAELRTLQRDYLGEGKIETQNTLVPIIPMTTVVSVEVSRGDEVEEGQVLARLDDSLARLQVSAAQAALRMALAESARTEAGSHQTQARERAELDPEVIESRRVESQILKTLSDLFENLEESGDAAKVVALQRRLEATRAQRELRQAELALEAAQAGRGQSIIVAENAVEQARAALAQRELDLERHIVRAPIAGVVEQVLALPGEFNRSPGRPGFVLFSGGWFEARLGQGAIDRVAVDDPVEVRLEAYPGQVFDGQISSIVPYVSYDLGGPETSRPIRPSGTGAPEWPSTFPVRVEMNGAGRILRSPGLTGFARIRTTREGLAIPTAALRRISKGRAVVAVVESETDPPIFEPLPGEVLAAGEGRYVSWSFQSVVTGVEDRGWVEILSGISANAEVMVKGHTLLAPGDPAFVVPDEEGK